MKYKKNTARIRMLVLALAFVFAACCLTACSDKDDGGDETHVLQYAGVDMGAHVRLGQYTGLTVTLAEGESRGEAVWRAVREGCEMIAYPEPQVEYYLEQSRERCRYYSNTHDVSYEEAVAALGYTEEAMLAEARALVASDMIGIALRADAGIVLTDEEKEKFFDKYVDKYVSDWGYNRSYVEDNLREEIYGSMLYDKTTEYLIKNNTFVSAE